MPTYQTNFISRFNKTTKKRISYAGFTLIELLIVVIIVGVLATVALPKYQRSLERSRALTGLATLRSAAEMLNAYYIVHDGTYPTVEQFAPMKQDLLRTGTSFTDVTYTQGTSVAITRNSWGYTLQATLGSGKINSIFCTSENGANTTCTQLGLEGNLLTTN